MLNEVELEELRMALAECEQLGVAVNERALSAVREARSVSFPAVAPEEEKVDCGESSPDLRSGAVRGALTVVSADGVIDIRQGSF